VDEEVRILEGKIKGQKRIPVYVTSIPTAQANYERIKSELSTTKYDIIHYAGHGSYVASSPEESCLYFWRDENRSEIVKMTAAELKMLLEQSDARFIYLSSCYGSASGGSADLLDDDFLGLADAVIQAGVPSALGFRWPVSDIGAQGLASTFYQSLLEQGSPEIALWHARRELAAVGRNDPTWLSPILIHQA